MKINPVVVRGEYLQKPLCSSFPNKRQLDNSIAAIVVKEYLKLNLTKIIVSIDNTYDTEFGISNFMNEVRIDDVLDSNFDFKELLNYYIANYINRILIRTNFVYDEQTISIIRNKVVELVQNSYAYMISTK